LDIRSSLFFLLVTVTIAIFPPKIMSTAVAIIRTNQWIVIAADSLAVDEFGKTIGNECKIRTIGKFVYVANKFTEDSRDQYNIHRIIENIPERDSIGRLGNALSYAIREPLIRSLTSARKRNPVLFRQNFSTTQALGITLAGLDDGTPSLMNVGFFIVDLEAKNLELRVEEHRCPGPDCPTGVARVLVGPQDLQQRFDQRFPRYWEGTADRLAETSEAFVQMAIDARLSDVGPPISVVVLGMSGLDQRKGRPTNVCK
jgi:hypothetical protein